MTPRASELPAAPDWDALAADFEAFHARFASLFARSESREQAIKYVRALMGPIERRNGWQMAEAIGNRTPDRVQRLLYCATWCADQARDRWMDGSGAYRWRGSPAMKCMATIPLFATASPQRGIAMSWRSPPTRRSGPNGLR
jgi:hypothetical protein